MAFLAGWSKRQKLTIDHTQVDDELTDFPVKVIIPSDNPLFYTAKNDGSDVRFTAADGETLLKFEREVHDTDESIAVYHVKIPSVSDTEDTDFYMYYGNAFASDASSPNDVWDSDYELVMHMGPSLEDSTSNGNDGTNYGTTLGLASDGYYRSFDGVNDYINCGGLLNNVSYFTLECVMSSSASYPKDMITAVTETITDYVLFRRHNEQPDFRVAVSGSDVGLDFGNYPTDANAHYYGGRYSSSSLVSFIDGALDESASHTLGGLNVGTRDVNIGRDGRGQDYFTGKIYEVRISSTVRSDAWIKATSASLHDELLTFGSEESAAPPIQGVHQGVQIIFI